VPEPSILSRLMEVIHRRKADRPRDSYTTQLLNGGIERIGAKVVEEAKEVVEAAGQAPEASSGDVIHEAADLVYHLLVLLAYCDRDLSDLEAELARRFGVCGLEEKAARGRAGTGGS